MRKILSVLLIAVIIMSSAADALAAVPDSQVGKVSVTTGYLNIRSGPSSSSSAVSKLNKGTYITLISKSGSWWKVEYGKGKYGYCYANYITAVPGSAASVKIQSGSLNVRSGAGTSYSKTGSLFKNETVIVLSSSGAWSRILYNGTKTGYVSSNYLSSSPSAYAPISLNVPKYRQSDSRWANVYIGNSGKTMAKIGCATTAIAMIESYRTGTSVYPDTMAKKLSYTSSGNVYWPAGYTAITDGTNFLSAIYKQLQQGKPVLFGAKKASGGQHWVVITGYSGGSSLTASGFAINDPGSGSRTNLQMFLNDYPNFYKYFIYS